MEAAMETTVRRDRSRKKPNAQGLVEFALIAPILLLVLFGIIDFGWMVFNFSQLDNGMRESARYGSVIGLGGTNQMKDCAGIYNKLVQLAGYARINQTKVHIWFDYGMAVEQDLNNPNALGTPLPDGPPPTTYANNPAAVVAYCWWNTNTNAWINPPTQTVAPAAPVTSYELNDPTQGGTCTATACTTNRIQYFDIQDGDRVVVDVNTNVPFLTPLISSFVPNGVPMHFRSARTVFPQGI